MRKEGVEPSRVSPPDPKSGASASSATFASGGTLCYYAPIAGSARHYSVGVRWRAALIIVALLAAVLPFPASGVEALYSKRLFPVIQGLTTRVSNLVPFALFDLFILAVVVWWLVQVIRELRAHAQIGWVRAVGRVIARTATIAAVAYLAFLVTWGFNYRRVPLQDKVQFDRSRLTSEAARQLAERSVTQANALYDAAHHAGWADAHVVDRALAQAFAAARQELGTHANTVPAVPKQSLFDLYFRRAGVAGMTDPYFLETFVASDLLPFERPFVVAHEWGHLAGFADEGDANFLAWLTCLRGTASHQYSGWLAVYGEVVGGLDRKSAADVSAKLTEGPRDDLRAVRERILQNISPQVSAAGWRVYDSYLKANKVEAGAASYADVVRLVLGTKFGQNWKPELR